MTDRRKKDEGEREEARRNEEEKREEGVESLALVWLRVSKWQQRTRAVIVFQPCRLATTTGRGGLPLRGRKRCQLVWRSTRFNRPLRPPQLLHGSAKRKREEMLLRLKCRSWTRKYLRRNASSA